MRRVDLVRIAASFLELLVLGQVATACNHSERTAGREGQPAEDPFKACTATSYDKVPMRQWDCGDLTVSVLDVNAPNALTPEAVENNLQGFEEGANADKHERLSLTLAGRRHPGTRVTTSVGTGGFGEMVIIALGQDHVRLVSCVQTSSDFTRCERSMGALAEASTAIPGGTP